MLHSGRKGLPGTNALAFYENLLLTAVKSFKTLAPGDIRTKTLRQRLSLVSSAGKARSLPKTGALYRGGFTHPHSH